MKLLRLTRPASFAELNSAATITLSASELALDETEQAELKRVAMMEPLERAMYDAEQEIERLEAKENTLAHDIKALVEERNQVVTILAAKRLALEAMRRYEPKPIHLSAIPEYDVDEVANNDA